jgi:hypothetical protein
MAGGRPCNVTDDSRQKSKCAVLNLLFHLSHGPVDFFRESRSSGPPYKVDFYDFFHIGLILRTCLPAGAV